MKHRFLLLLLCLLLSTSIQAQNGLNFDGVNDRINCGNDASVQLSGTQITLEAWIYATAWQPNVFEGGIINKEQNNPDNGYMLRAGDGGRLNFNLGNFGWNELTTLPILNLNTWHHVAGTYDGSMMRLYVDGMAIDSQTVSITLSSASQNLTIGNWSNPGSERPFIGVIDEVRIWDVARSQADLISAMSTELCNPPASLIVYYRLNEGSAGGNNASQTTATDASGNGNDGTLINFALSGTSSNWATGTVPAGAAIGMDVQTACDSYTWIDGNTYTTSNNNATFTIVGGAASGCDSLVSLDLTINAAAQGTDVQTACDTYTWIDGNTYTMSNNSASFTLAGGAANGCDSVVTLDLTINAAAQGVDVQTACNTYTWIDGNTYTSDNNSASFTLAGGAANGCDSVVTLDLTIETIETGVTQAGITLTSNSDTSGVSYQWLDCNNASAPIAGENAASFTATVNGSYAVEVSRGSCVDTSACVAVTTVGLDDQHFAGTFTLFPNPTNGQLKINFEAPQTYVQLKVLNLFGQEIQSETIQHGNAAELWIEGAPGVYLLEISDADQRKSVVKLVKQ